MLSSVLSSQGQLAPPPCRDEEAALERLAHELLGRHVRAHDLVVHKVLVVGKDIVVQVFARLRNGARA